MYICISLFIHTYTSIYTASYMHVYMDLYICIYIHIHTHPHVYTCISTKIHVFMLIPQGGFEPLSLTAREVASPLYPLAVGRAVAYCSPAACRLHRAEEREREERERRAYHRHPRVGEGTLCICVGRSAHDVAAETEGRIWVSAHSR